MNSAKPLGAQVAQSAGILYQQVLASDSKPVPEELRINNPTCLGTDDIPIERYLDRKFHELEKQKIWKKVWQVACREENIPDIGDVALYEIVGISIMVVRTEPTTIKAFFNACLHQGRALIDRPCQVSELRCPFHGFTWSLRGTIKRIPSPWDYPQIDGKQFSLPELKVGTWGGFVFVNMDPHCESLETFLGDLTSHFKRAPLTDRYIAAHVAKVLRANWKTAMEPFMESFHVLTTHPQILASNADENSQYDVFGNFSRAITFSGIPSPNVKWEPTQEYMASIAFNNDDPTGAGKAPQTIPEGMTYRQFGAEQARDRLRAVIGERADQMCDSDLMDSFYYTLFPNFHPWGAYNHIAYRFTPYKDHHDMCVMETWMLAPFSGPRPPPAACHWIGVDGNYLEATELGELARIFHQDESNIERVQQGMHTLRINKPGTTLGAYQFTKIRHFHKLYEEYLSR
jgi:phenylpropionate dioxygenase-like ring-hydroxylating dioxygenase large terminal subunit